MNGEDNVERIKEFLDLHFRLWRHDHICFVYDIGFDWHCRLWYPSAARFYLDVETVDFFVRGTDHDFSFEEFISICPPDLAKKFLYNIDLFGH